MITENGRRLDSPAELSGNRIIGRLQDEDAEITFGGRNNMLVLEGDVRLTDSRLNFPSDGGLIYLRGSEKQDFHIDVTCWRESTVFIDRNNYFNGMSLFTIIASERRSVLIGRGGRFSFNIWVRTADPHILYDIESGERINPSRDVVIGDHVWLGQDATLLKGTIIGSGSVVGASAVCSGRRIESNTVYVGNPARKVREGVFFSGASVHNYTEEKTEQSMHRETDKFTYNDSTEGSLLEAGLLDSLQECRSVEERLELVKAQLSGKHDKHRFAVVR